MVGFLVSCLVLGYIVGPMSLMLLIENEPKKCGNAPRWLLQAYCVVAFYICNLIIYWTGWGVISKVMITFFIGYAILAAKIIWEKVKQKKQHELNIIRGSWVILYMVGLCIISYLSSFHGHNVIPFGIDFVVMGIFTIAVYSFARYVAVKVTNPISSIDTVQQDSV